MKKRCWSLALAVLLALSCCCIPAAAAMDYGLIYDETEQLSSEAVRKLGEDVLPMLSDQLDLQIQVDVLTNWTEGDIAGDAAEIYDRFNYGYGEDHRGVTLTLGVDYDEAETRVTMSRDNWCVYVGGTDAALTGSSLAADVTAAAAPYLTPQYWGGDLDVTRSALALAVNAMAGAVRNTLQGSDDALTDLTDGLLTGESADSAGIYVYDLADLFSYEEWEQLEEQAETLSQKYGCGIYTVIVDDYTAYGSGSTADVAEYLYDDNDLGLGEQQNGILLLLSMAERDYSLYVSGETAEYAFNTYARERLTDEFLDKFGENDWAGGIGAYITASGADLDGAADGKPVRENPVYRIALGIGMGCFVAFVVCMFLKRKMKSVHIGMSAGEYVAAGGLTLTDSYDRYTHTTETRRSVKDNSDPGSPGGGKHSSGKF